LAVLCIAIGNALRGDDGAGQRVLELLGHSDRVLMRSVVQLTPELAAEVAAFEIVLFIDADVACSDPHIESVSRGPIRGTPLTHAAAIFEVVGLAERIYGFSGASFICRVPARAFEIPEALSPVAEAGAHSAVDLIRKHPVLSHQIRELEGDGEGLCSLPPKARSAGCC
jgi:hydrogenase maturation protease